MVATDERRTMITPRRRQAAVAVVVAALTFGLAACGPSTGSATRSPTKSAHWFAINGVPLADLIDQLNATSGDFLSKDEPDAIATCQRASYDITLLDGGLTDVAPTGDTRLFADLEFALAALAPGISACERGGLDAKVVSPEGDAALCHQGCRATSPSGVERSVERSAYRHDPGPDHDNLDRYDDCGSGGGIQGHWHRLGE